MTEAEDGTKSHRSRDVP